MADQGEALDAARQAIGTAAGANASVLLALAGISKSYGSTRANQDLDLHLKQGEVLGLVGANGAGKSTLMRILCGVTIPDSGSLSMAGSAIDLSSFSPRAAQAQGIRIVWQELSLAPNLSVAENFYVEQPGHARPSPFWRGDYHRLACDSIEAIFAGANISTSRAVAELTIAQRQMVEIARAASDPRLRLLILDEPTSSLGAERSAQLRGFVRSRAAMGIAIVFISHKLSEVLDVSDRVVAMRNGRLVWERVSGKTSVAELVEAMGTASAVEQRQVGERAVGQVRITLSGRLAGTSATDITLRAGEIVGVAGLEGSGQKDLLQLLFAGSGTGDVRRNGEVRYVSGDRQREGVFPLWNVLDNISIGSIAHRPWLKRISAPLERQSAAVLARRLALDESRLESGILDLSGGNQQKALVARALADRTDIILLDDPTRGVDIAAKRDFYRLVHEIADAGCLVVWHSTEDVEFLECHRVLVFARGEVVAELAGTAIDEESVVAASFLQSAGTSTKAGTGSAGIAAMLRAVPFASLLAVFAVMAWLNPLVASSFGLELLLAPAVTLVLIALAQMFVVGGSEIDLGVGAYAGFVNVVSATLLVMSPTLGVLALLAGFAGYALIGTLIQARAIPAIVVTLGASFIWTGMGQTLQPSPGGESPQWLASLFTWSLGGVPTPLLLILAAGLVAFMIDRSPTGTILRGFGSSPLALQRGGWSPLRYSVLRYLIACAFATTAGLYVTATNNASDINASSSFTLLGIAAVVIGGCQLLGGVIAPLGVVAGAVTLSLIGALLASLGVSTNYNAAVQGGLLIAMLGLQALAQRGRRHG